MSEDRQELTTSQEGNILVLVLDRPQTRNAVSAGIAQAMEAALDRLETSADLWAAVLTHEGPVFCAGADLKAVQRGEAASLSTERGGFGGIVARQRTKPLIAAVDGPALAGGFEMVLAADLVVASTNATFALPEVRRGLLAAGGGLIRAMSALPRNIGLEMLLAGRALSAQDGERFGLVNRLCEPGEARAVAMGLAAEVVKGAPLALAATRRIALATLTDAELTSRLSVEKELALLYASADVQEALSAFFDKRPPNWTGR